MSISITGNGHNSMIKLYMIHKGVGSFRKDTATTHSQVKLLQEALTSLGFSTNGADGKFGNNTLSAVRAFQTQYGLEVDGYFGMKSLNKLEEILGTHLDVEDCDTPCLIDEVKNISGETYKQMNGLRVITAQEALVKINSYTGIGSPITAASYLTNLKNMAQQTSPTLYYTSYKDGVKCDCSGYTYLARNKQGYHGATTNFCEHVKYFGSIAELGKNNLIPGMELYQAYRKTANSPYYYASHTGVYAGLKDLGNGELVPAVYQSSSSYSVIDRLYGKSSGPELTELTNSWTYWGWSKYVKHFNSPNTSA